MPIFSKLRGSSNNSDRREWRPTHEGDAKPSIRLPIPNVDSRNPDEKLRGTATVLSRALERQYKTTKPTDFAQQIISMAHDKELDPRELLGLLSANIPIVYWARLRAQLKHLIEVEEQNESEK